METKICSCCKQTLNVIKFPVRSDRPDKYRSKCYECQRIFNRKWASLNRNAIHARNRKYYLANSTRHKIYGKAWRKKNPIRKLLQGARERAQKHNLIMTITEQDISIPEFCPVLGIPLQINQTGGRGRDNSPSLDRINPQKGYIKGNVAVISYRANMIKNAGNIDEHEKIINYMKQSGAF